MFLCKRSPTFNSHWSTLRRHTGFNLARFGTYHADFDGVEQVKGQRGHQVDDEPRGQVMDANLSSVEDHLARLADVSRAKVKNNIWKEKVLVIKMQVNRSHVKMFQSAKPTYDEQNLYTNVADSRAAGHLIVVSDEAHVVRHRHGYVERSEQNQPVPACFECTVVE